MSMELQWQIRNQALKNRETLSGLSSWITEINRRDEEMTELSK
ncbi:hypothetical protein KIPB_015706, partial [Kipferlia bialata]|eukprot:g15706.t1